MRKVLLYATFPLKPNVNQCAIEGQTELDNSVDIHYSQHDIERSCYDSDDDDEIYNNNGSIKNEEKLLILNKNVGLIEDDVSLRAHSFTPETSLLEASNTSINSENSEAQTITLPG